MPEETTKRGGPIDAVCYERSTRRQGWTSWYCGALLVIGVMGILVGSGCAAHSRTTREPTHTSLTPATAGHDGPAEWASSYSKALEHPESCYCWLAMEHLAKSDQSARAERPAILKAFRSDDLALRCAALVLLGKADDEEATGIVKAQLKNEAPLMRILATRVLRKRGSADAVERLMPLLDDDWRPVREEAAMALAQIGSPAVKALTGALDEKSVRVRMLAAAALGEIGEQGALEALRRRLGDEDQAVACCATWAICRIRLASVKEFKTADLSVAGEPEAYRAQAERNLAVLVKSMKLVDGYSDIYAYQGRDEKIPRLIADAGGAKAVVPLASFYLHLPRNVGTRNYAAWDLLKRCGKDAAGEFLEVTERAVRRGPARNLDWLPGSYLDTDAFEAIFDAREALDDAERETADAVRALADAGERRACEQLLALAGRGGLEGLRAAIALARLGDARSAPLLVVALGSADLMARMDARDALRGLGPAAIPAATAGLDATDLRVRRECALLLGEIGERVALPAIRKQLRDADEPLRWSAAWALCRIRQPGVAQPDAAALKEEAEEVRAAAEAALARLKKITEVLAAARDIEDDAAHARAVQEAVKKLGGEKQLLDALSSYVRLPIPIAPDRIAAPGVLAYLHDDAVPVLAELLAEPTDDYYGHEQRWLAYPAIAGLKCIGSRKAIEAMGKVLLNQDEDVGYRYRNARAIGRLADPRATDILIKTAEDKAHMVRYWSIWALGAAGDQRAADVLVRLFERDRSLRDKITAAMAQSAAPQFAAPLTKALAEKPQTPEDLESKAGVVRALGELGPKAAEAIPALVELLGDEGHRSIRGFVAEALGRIGPAAKGGSEGVKALLKSTNERDRVVAARALWRITGEAGEAAEALAGVVRAGELQGKDLAEMNTWWAAGHGHWNPHDWRLDAEAAKVLGQIGPPAKGAVPALEELLAGGKGYAQTMAALALWRMTGKVEGRLAKWISELKDPAGYQSEVLGIIGPAAKEALPALEKVLSSAYSYRGSEYAAAWAHWRVSGKPDKALPMLLARLKRDGIDDCCQAADVLGMMGSDAKEAVPEMEKRLRHWSGWVRRAAQEALDKIGAGRPTLQANPKKPYYYQPIQHP